MEILFEEIFTTVWTRHICQLRDPITPQNHKRLLPADSPEFIYASVLKIAHLFPCFKNIYEQELAST